MPDRLLQVIFGQGWYWLEREEAEMVRSLLAVLFLAGCALAVSDDGAACQGLIPSVPGGGSDDISVTILNTWQPSYATQILGLEYRASDDAVIFVSSSQNKIFIADADNGSQLGSVDRPAGLLGFGVAWTGTEYFVNAWNGGNIYHSTGSGGWTAFSNPAGANGRGLAYGQGAGNFLWESNGMNAMAFNPDGSGAASVSLSGISYQISGLATFDLTTDMAGPCGLAVTCYNESPPKFHFFIYDGSSATPLGTVTCPGSPSASYGLCYTSERGTFFWSYVSGGIPYVSELQIDGLVPLGRSSWGEIKSLF